MSDEPDFPIATSDAELGAANPPTPQPLVVISDAELGAADPPTPPPLVVIQYRSRLFPALLLPPALILLTAAFIVMYRVQIADWPGFGPLRPERTGTALASEPAAITNLPSPPSQIVLRVQNTSVPTQEPAHAEQAASTATGPGASPAAMTAHGSGSPASPDRPQAAATAALGPASALQAANPVSADAEAGPADGNGGAAAPAIAAGIAPAALEIGFGPPDMRQQPTGAVRPPNAPAEADTPTKEQVWGDIKRQAAEQKANRENLEKMKPIWLEQERREAERRSQIQLAEALQIADEDRPAFLAELKRLVNQRGNRAAADIEDLSERYGRDTMPQVEEKVHKVLAGPAARLGRNERVNMLRYYGLSETRILDYLAHAEAKNISKRNGPRNEEEALVRAAKQLLAVPLPPPPQAQPQAPAQQQPQPSASSAAGAPKSSATTNAASASAGRPQIR